MNATLRTIKRLAIVVLVAAATAAAVFPLTAWLSESFHIDCRRAGSPPRCVVEISRRGSTQLHAFDVARLAGAEVDSRIVRDSEGNVDETHHLRLLVHAESAAVSKPGRIDSAADSRQRHRERAEIVNRFVAQPGEPALKLAFDNRWDQRLAAWIVVLAATVGAAWFAFRR